MRKIVLLGLSVLLVLGCSGEGKKSLKRYTAEQFFSSSRTVGGSFSPDSKKLLVSSNVSGIYNLYEISFEDGSWKQITFSDKESFFEIRYLPNGEGILCLSDKGGDEVNHIFLIEEEGKIADITPFKGRNAEYFSIGSDEKGFYFTANLRDERYNDLYYKNFADLKEPQKYKLIYKNEKGLDPFDISDNDRYLILLESTSFTNDNLYLHDLKTGQTELFTKHSGDARYIPKYFSKDDRFFYYLTNENYDYLYLARFDLATGKKEIAFATDADIKNAGSYCEGRFSYIGILREGRPEARLYDIKAGKKLVLPEIPGRNIVYLRVRNNGKYYLIKAGSSISPVDYFYYSAETGKLLQLTQNLNPAIDLNDLVRAESVHFSSFDGLTLQAFLYKPREATSENRVPALVVLHGGPNDITKDEYIGVFQFLVNHGYALLAVNYRGSAGFGKKFSKLLENKHGYADVKDCIASKKYLETLDFIEKDKIGITGVSYGGFLTLASLARPDSEFKVGVSIAGPVDWVRLLRGIPVYWESVRKALYNEMGDPFTKDSVKLKEISPLYNAEKIRNPVCILQGGSDPRALPSLTDKFVEVLKKRGIPVVYIYYEDEGHGFRKKTHKIEAYEKVLKFLNKYLK